METTQREAQTLTYQMVCCRHTGTCNPGPPIITETGSGDNELRSTPQDIPLSTAASKQ